MDLLQNALKQQVKAQARACKRECADASCKKQCHSVVKALADEAAGDDDGSDGGPGARANLVLNTAQRGPGMDMAENGGAPSNDEDDEADSTAHAGASSVPSDGILGPSAEHPGRIHPDAPLSAAASGPGPAGPGQEGAEAPLHPPTSSAVPPISMGLRASDLQLLKSAYSDQQRDMAKGRSRAKAVRAELRREARLGEAPQAQSSSDWAPGMRARALQEVERARRRAAAQA